MAKRLTRTEARKIMKKLIPIYKRVEKIYEKTSEETHLQETQIWNIYMGLQNVISELDEI